MSTFLLSLLLLLAATPQQTTTPNPADLCTIQGVVIKAGTGEPLHKATVEARVLGGPSQGISTMTDAMGRFELKGLAPGQYRLSAKHNGFVTEEYGQQTLDGHETTLTLSSGQKVPEITFQLIPAAAITGHVFDEDGEPLVGAYVLAMHFVYSMGRRELSYSRSAQTNDLGEFRIFGLSPGQYVVLATFENNVSAKPTTREGYVPIYFPGVPDVSRAAPITVRGGDEFSGADISLQPVRTVTIKGHIINAGCGASAMGPMLILENNSPDATSQGGDFDTTAQGAFEIHKVIPGSYYLSAKIIGAGKQCFGRLALEVGDADIGGITINVTPGVELKGRLRVEGQLGSSLGSLNVILFPKGTDGTFRGVPTDSTKADGNFLLKNAYDGDYEINVDNLPDNYFVKSARLDGIDVLSAGLTIDPRQAPGSLEIVVSPNGANVDGAISKDQQPFQGATVAIVPDAPHRGEKRLFKSTTTDQNGHFVLQGISPGDYRVFAWEKIDPAAYTSPEFLQPYEKLGESVHITEGSRNSVQVDLIPAKDTNQ
jgi:protocatechuate 3,4-dioxygenase beta subunit